MPAEKQDQVLVACPHCGHQQPEWRAAFSTICRKCGRHYRVQEALRPTPRAPDRAPPQRRVKCFDCGLEMDAPASAESTMCKRCSRYIDLHDYLITAAASKNFRTRGRFVVEPKGYVFNSETIADHVVIRGRFHGKLTAEKSLTIHSGAEIKGSLTAAHLIIPAENHFRWPTVLQVDSAEIAGEYSGVLTATHVVTLKSTARWFGELTVRNLVTEPGAVIVGSLRIGPPDRVYNNSPLLLRVSRDLTANQRQTV